MLAQLGRHDQLRHLAPDHVLGAVAEGALGRGVEVDDAALVVHGHHAVERGVEHRAVPRLLLAQRLRVAPALDRLADLVAEAVHGRQQLGVDLARLGGEELDHAEHAAGAADGEAEGGVQARAPRRLGAREVVVGRDVRRSRPARPSATPGRAGPPPGRRPCGGTPPRSRRRRFPRHATSRRSAAPPDGRAPAPTRRPDASRGSRRSPSAPARRRRAGRPSGPGCAPPRAPSSGGWPSRPMILLLRGP